MTLNGNSPASSTEHCDPGIPDGWFAVAWSKDLITGEVRRVRCFDQEMVLFRARSGELKLLNAYCPHLGAHLAEGGRVTGETIRCPFHGWHYDGDGQCVKIPYCETIPAKAKVRAWHVCERNEMVFAWHHSGGQPPSWEVPVIEELGDPDWSEPRTFDLTVPVHMQDMAENNCDPVHFQYVHAMSGIPPSEVSYADEGRFMRMVSTSEQDTPLGTFEMTLVRDAWGLGLVSVRSQGIPNAGLLMFSSTSPVDSHNTHSRWVFTATRNLVDVAGEEWFKTMSTGVLQDMQIWKNKIHRQQPVLCEADDYLAEFRRWTKQFYSADAQV